MMFQTKQLRKLKIQHLAAILLAISCLAGCQNAQPPLISLEEAAKFDSELPSSDQVAFNTWENNPFIGDEKDFLYLLEEVDGEPVQLPDGSVLSPGHKYRLVIYCHNTARAIDDENDIARLVKVCLEYPMRMSAGNQDIISAELSGYANGSAIPSCSTSLMVVAESNLAINLVTDLDEVNQKVQPHLLALNLMGENVSEQASYSTSFQSDRVQAEITLGNVPSGLAESRIIIYEIEVSLQPEPGGVG